MMRLDWNRLTSAGRAAALARPACAQSPGVIEAVRRILAEVRYAGDHALRRLTRDFEGCVLDTFEVSVEEFAAAEKAVPETLKLALRAASARLEAFHKACRPGPVRVETAPGVVCERLARPIARVGLYVPAGSAPLPSTALMLGVPARLAGCPQAVMCTPPRPDGRADTAVLYAARLLGINRVFKLGGAQAIAALAFGTESVPRCDKLFGPGNVWVTEAKRQASLAPDGPAIDMAAGPSEVLVIADAAASARHVVADLLSQAEHGPDSQVLLLTDAPELLEAVGRELQAQLAALPRAAIARQALSAARLILVDSLSQAAEVSNAYAPEHLILNVRAPRALLARIESAGSVFIGPWSPEAAGDYASGTNHVLPTGGQARVRGGLSVADFQKQLTVQELSAEGLRGIGPDVLALAQAEGLIGHARAVSLRLAEAAP